jgi:hypothetical protein
MDNEQRPWWRRRVIYRRGFEAPNDENLRTLSNVSTEEPGLAPVVGIAWRCYWGNGITQAEADLVRSELANSLLEAKDFNRLNSVLDQAVAKGHEDGLEADT